MNIVRWLGNHTKKFAITVVVLGITVTMVTFRLQAESIGKMTGSAAGAAVGTALGSFEGITKGYRKGQEDAKTTALKAEDTTVMIKKTMQSVGKLDVLSAGVTLHNMNRVGDSNPVYVELSVTKGVIVFSVDLTDVSVSFNSDKSKAFVYAKEPKAELSIDWANTEILASQEKASINVTAVDGVEEIVNSINQIDKKSKEELKNHVSNYDELYTAAKDAAGEQIKNLVESINGESRDVQVIFALGNGAGR